MKLSPASRAGPRSAGASGNKGSVTPARINCSAGDVILKIDGVPEVSKGSTPGVTRWGVVGVSQAATKCRFVSPITATIRDASGKVLTKVDGTRDAKFVPEKLRYHIELDPHTPTFVAHLNWLNPCSDGPVVLEVDKLSGLAARLHVPKQACRYGGSFFSVDGPGAIAGTRCPNGSITLTISPHGIKTGVTVRWAVTGISHANFLCRTFGLDAAIQTVDGKVLTVVPGNPAVQNDVFQDLFAPSRSEFVDYLQWSKPCSTGPVVLVVGYHDGMSGPGARLRLPQPRCVDGVAGHFQITGQSTNP